MINEGNAFNLNSGVFSAPRNGTYFFVFSTSADSFYGSLSLALELNDEDIASCKKNSHGFFHCSIPYTLKLKSGDRIQVSVKGGSLDNAIFVGFLIAEDIFPS